MKRVKIATLGTLFVIALIRLALYLGYAYYDLAIPYEVFHLESKMVLLAYRVQAGLSLYPRWDNYPHVANFFGPVYFMIVGMLGRVVQADIPTLQAIGRGVTFSAALITSLLIGLRIKLVYGFWAAICAALLSLDGSPMFGFSVMVRADLLAETFGTAGFLLCIQSRRHWRVLGGIFLLLAILTKQTTAIFLLAAVLTLWLQHMRWDALVLLAATALATLLAIVVITWVLEPRFAVDFLGEGKTPWLLQPWLHTLNRMSVSAPDMFLLPIVALILASLRGRQEPALLALTLVVGATSLIASAKQGADLNYFLNLRVCEGLAAGVLWQLIATATTRKETTITAIGSGLVLVALVQSTVYATIPVSASMQKHDIWHSPAGRSALRNFEKMSLLALRPDIRLLTDSGILELYQKERAAFGDPWLFRVMVDTGRIKPEQMKRWIESESYDIVVTTSDFLLPTYRTYEFGLPMYLVESLRTHYVANGVLSGFFIYSRRGLAPTTSREAPGAPLQPGKP